MLTTNAVLRQLPASMGWAVVFRLAPLRSQFPDELLRRCFGVGGLELGGISHVALTSNGPFVVPVQGSAYPLHGEGSGPHGPQNVGGSLFDRYAARLTLIQADADCVGVGELYPHPPVALGVVIEGRMASGIAVLDKEPRVEVDEHLDAVGVQRLGGNFEHGFYLARFRNDLAKHLFAGVLSGFSRTENCNLFFLRQASLDERLEHGLRAAAGDVVSWAAGALKRALATEIARGCPEDFAMSCRGPDGPETRYGEVVPLGLARFGLGVAPDARTGPVLHQLDTWLDAVRQGSLWSFATGGLPTCTDSALVLLGRADRGEVEELQKFRAVDGYLPQLTGGDRSLGQMRSTFSTRLWEQEDLGTTCVVRHLRVRSGRSADVRLEYLARWFERRAGLFFANPYLVDWVLALALSGDAQAHDLRERLAGEVASSAAGDGTFGTFDEGLSTALAILTLDATGFGDSLVRHAQLRLLDFLDSGMFLRNSTPFHSALLREGGAHGAPSGDGGGRSTARESATVTYYRDASGVVGTALAAAALSVRTDGHRPPPRVRSAPHLRYRCAQDDYIHRHCLPQYLPAETALRSSDSPWNAGERGPTWN